MQMLDLIDRKVMLKTLENSGVLGEFAKYLIKKQSAVDAVEVVRCKDCKWYKVSKLLAPDKFCFRLKDKKGDILGYNFTPDGFCSYGEREDNNGKK